MRWISHYVARRQPKAPPPAKATPLPVHIVERAGLETYVLTDGLMCPPFYFCM